MRALGINIIVLLIIEKLKKKNYGFRWFDNKSMVLWKMGRARTIGYIVQWCQITNCNDAEISMFFFDWDRFYRCW